VTQVLELRQSERVIIDAQRMELLFIRHGARGAEAMVMDTVEDISDRLAEIEACYRANRLDGIPERAQRVSRLSSDIGLTSLARVARDLGISARGGDMVAYRAIWERLVRIGDRSLEQVWNLPGLQM
jgi:hypothetical protein